MTAPAPAEVRTLTAKWAGECRAATCERDTRTIQAGEVIKYAGTRGAISHAGCPDPDPAQVPAPAARPARRGRRGRRYSRYAYTAGGAQMSERCGCEDYPCCGH